MVRWVNKRRCGAAGQAPRPRRAVTPERPPHSRDNLRPREERCVSAAGRWTKTEKKQIYWRTPGIQCTAVNGADKGWSNRAEEGDKIRAAEKIVWRDAAAATAAQPPPQNTLVYSDNPAPPLLGSINQVWRAGDSLTCPACSVLLVGEVLKKWIEANVDPLYNLSLGWGVSTCVCVCEAMWRVTFAMFGDYVVTPSSNWCVH